MHRRVSLPQPSLIDACGGIEVVRLVSRVLLGALILIVLGMTFLPWRQTVSADGRVIAFDPVERQHAIEAPIKGIIAEWHVQEGQEVEAGQLIAEITDNDPNYLQRLEAQVDAASLRLQAVDASIGIARARIQSLTDARAAAIDSAELDIGIATDSLEAVGSDVAAAEAEYEAARSQLERVRALRDKQLASERELELAIASEGKAKNKLVETRAKTRAARRKIEASRAKRAQVASKDAASVESARGSLEKLQMDRTKVLEDIQKLEAAAARQRSMQITAPRAGIIGSITGRAGVEYVKEGDVIATLVPNTEARAVEAWVDGNDAPLVTPGREVRLQFEGWPAVQFVGWPSVAVGTFAGKVAFVDPSADGSGRFRVVVVPDPEAEEPWPESRFLRQGARARVWLLLNEVSVAYELWRQINGFPPSMPAPPDTGKSLAAPAKAK